MKHRMRAAWKVLRGEWVAHAPVKPVDPTLVYTSNGTSATNVSWTWTQPPAFDPKRAARRAVHKHGDALRRLAE